MFQNGNQSGLPQNAVWAGSKKNVQDDDDMSGANGAESGGNGSGSAGGLVLGGGGGGGGGSGTGNKKRSHRVGRKRDEQFLHQSLSEKSSSKYSKKKFLNRL